MNTQDIVSDEVVKFYNDNGYAVVENFFDEARCKELTEAAERKAKGNYTNYLDLHRTQRDFYNLITDPRLLAAADKIFGARMIPIGSIFFFCKPNNPLENGSEMHQDNYSSKSPEGAYCVVAAILDDADEENGSLIVYPGTNKCGDLPCTPKKNFDLDAQGRIVKAYPIGNPTEIPPGFSPVQLRYKRGSLLFLHSWTIHGAPKNNHSTRWRRQMYFHFIKDGAPFWPGWNAKRQIMERNLNWEGYRESVRKAADALVD